MRIDSMLRERQTLSFEVFPPKPEHDADLSGIKATLSGLTAAKPDFVSVTYGAGGQNRPRALDIAEMVLQLGMEPLSHLTAVGYTKSDTARVTDALGLRGVENILALRGDIPVDRHFSQEPWVDFRYALDLVDFIHADRAFCLGGAAYPEKHTESASLKEDIEIMKRKSEAGVSFFITQLFFDNDLFLQFRDRARKNGVETPIIAGIMPVLQARQIKRIVEISGCSVPGDLRALLDKYEDDAEGMTKAGIDFAAKQIAGLWKAGVDGIHVYTMNKSHQVLDIVKAAGLFENDGRGVR